MRRETGRSLLRVAVALMLVSAGCSARPAVRPTATPLRAALAPGASVLVLAPSVRFENMRSEAPLTGSAYDATAFLAPLSTAAFGAAAAAGAVVVACTADGGVAPAPPLCGALAPYTAPLSRGVVRPQAAAVLAHDPETSAPPAVLATAMLSRFAPVATDPPMLAGEIRDASASTVLSAALVDPDGRVRWRNDVLLREIPEATDEGYRQALDLLFSAAPPP